MKTKPELSAEISYSLPKRKQPFKSQRQGFSKVSALLLVTALIVASTLTIFLMQGAVS